MSTCKNQATIVVSSKDHAFLVFYILRAFVVKQIEYSTKPAVIVGYEWL